MKGGYNQECYRSICNNNKAVFFNHSTKQYYCTKCAREINDVNHFDAQRMFGHELCTFVSPDKAMTVQTLVETQNKLNL